MSEQLNLNKELLLNVIDPDELDVKNYTFFIEHKYPNNFKEHDRKMVNQNHASLITLTDPISGLITAASITPVFKRSSLQIALEQQSRFASKCSLIHEQTRIFNHQLLYTVSNLLTCGELYIDTRNFADSHIILPDNIVIRSSDEVNDIESALSIIVNKLITHICYHDFALLDLPEISDAKKYLDMCQDISIDCAEDFNIISVNLKYNNREIFAQFDPIKRKNKNDTIEKAKQDAVDLFVLGSLLPKNMEYVIPYTLIDTDSMQHIRETKLSFSDLVTDSKEE